ncbi:hypothetical protein BOX15_Mlig004779g1, partial [Macrostomum lignano]
MEVLKYVQNGVPNSFSLSYSPSCSHLRMYRSERTKRAQLQQLEAFTKAKQIASCVNSVKNTFQDVLQSIQEFNDKSETLLRYFKCENGLRENVLNLLESLCAKLKEVKELCDKILKEVKELCDKILDLINSIDIIDLGVIRYHLIDFSNLINDCQSLAEELVDLDMQDETESQKRAVFNLEVLHSSDEGYGLEKVVKSLREPSLREERKYLAEFSDLVKNLSRVQNQIEACLSDVGFCFNHCFGIWLKIPPGIEKMSEEVQKLLPLGAEARVEDLRPLFGLNSLNLTNHQHTLANLLIGGRNLLHCISAASVKGCSAGGQQHTKCARMLLDGEANTEIPDTEERLPLHLAVMSMNHSLVNLLLEKCSDLMHVCRKDKQKWTPLMYAAKLNCSRAASFLLSAMRRTFMTSEAAEVYDEDKVNAVIIARQNYNEEVPKVVVDYGLNLQHRSKYFQKTLVELSNSGNVLWLPIVRMAEHPKLLQICEIASSGEFEKLAELLSEDGTRCFVNEHCLGLRDRTPLLCAAAAASSDYYGYGTDDHVKCARILLDNGADVNQLDADRNSALHLAVKSNNRSLISILLAVDGILKECKNIDGQTPLELETQLNDSDCKSLPRSVDNPVAPKCESETICSSSSATELEEQPCSNGR